MTSVGSNSSVDVHVELLTPSPSTCVHLNLTPSPPCGRHKWMATKCSGLRVKQ